MDDAAAPSGPQPTLDQTFLYELQMELTRLANRYGTDPSVDLAFLVYLRKMSRFGYFTYGPITIDVRLIEDIVDRTVRPCSAHGPGHHAYDDDYVRFSRLLMDEVQQSGRRRIDELHFLFAFMKTKEGLPARVFGELGVTPGQVAERGQPAPGSEPPALEKLYSPEEVADYLGVHVQTVRGWIRSGRLPARRLAGQRALRVRACDLSGLLEPVNPDEI